jgi:iron complex transport system substrate-binding protein
MTGARLAAALLLLVALPGAAWSLTVTDQAGRPVTLPAPPRRIVSLVPSASEILFAIGAEDRLVGVTDFCDWPPAARAKPRVGGMLNPSLETIVRLGPDLVVATDDGNREETVAQIERLGIPVYLVRPARVAEALDVIARLGALTGRGAEARALVDALTARIDRVRAAVAPRGRPRVLYVLWPEPLTAPGRGALVSELIELAGGRSVTADAPVPYPRYSLEAAVASAPEIIVLARHGGGQGPMARERWERFSHLPAIRSGRLHAADGNLTHRYGPRMVDGLEALARIIHPGAFAGAHAR